MIGANRFFKYSERAGVWAASSESSYEGIGFCVVLCEDKAKADVRSYKKISHTQARKENFKVNCVLAIRLTSRLLPSAVR